MIKITTIFTIELPDESFGEYREKEMESASNIVKTALKEAFTLEDTEVNSIQIKFDEVIDKE